MQDAAELVRAAPHTPNLNFQKVPHWGWRARIGAYRFEIERTGYQDGPRFRAFVRRDGRSPPVATKPFGTTIAARAWLELQHAALGPGASAPEVGA